MNEIIDALVIGAGSAGLGVSYFLQQRACLHHVLERGRKGETWRTQRWDLRLNSTNILTGDAYKGPDPWGAITHHEFVAYLEDYVDRHRLPVRTRVAVVGLNREDGAYQVITHFETFMTRSIVIATGDQSQQVRPPWSSDLPTAIRQVDSSAYPNPDELADGAVLVVGSGQSGGQIAEDLGACRRRMFLATFRRKIRVCDHGVMRVQKKAKPAGMVRRAFGGDYKRLTATGWTCALGYCPG